MYCFARIDYDKDLVMKQVEGGVHMASDLTLCLVDFGGQSVFNVIHHLFFRRQAVYIVVFNMQLMLDPATRASCLKSLRTWLNSITVHTLDSATMLTASIAIVGSRGDEVRVYQKIYK